MTDLILFDLKCPFCQRWVVWVQNQDTRHRFIFSSLHGKTAESMSSFLSLADQESVILIENYNTAKQKVSYRSRAVLTILWKLGGFWKLIGWKKNLPPVFFDWFYNLISKNRTYLCSKTTSYLKEFDQKRFLP